RLAHNLYREEWWKMPFLPEPQAQKIGIRWGWGLEHTHIWVDANLGVLLAPMDGEIAANLHPLARAPCNADEQRLDLLTNKGVRFRLRASMAREHPVVPLPIHFVGKGYSL
ncbi:MAG TPA: hypothetical protein VK459_22740, partial [Polyangiaceae bacterium]|nr:hypothetical protein [Polyangiaceae bacterium]